MNNPAMAILKICLICAVATSALAQQPPNPVTSDSLANTAMGSNALLNMDLSETACHNTASGKDALFSDISGSYNTATGFSSLYSNTSGDNNTATGYESLYSNSTGNDNTASGYQALYTNATGSFNTALGDGALRSATTGSNNIGVGYEAGSNVTSGINNIDIGNAGAANDRKAIRIGTPGAQTTARIAGIYNVPLTGNAVVVTSTGQLGVVAVSSQRFKDSITPMGSNTANLELLRPVTFKLKSDAKGTLQYGLIAEEVAKVYPELVIRDEKGRIDGVRYDELSPMLLNEVQQQAMEIRELKAQLAGIQAVLLKLQPNDQLVAQR